MSRDTHDRAIARLDAEEQALLKRLRAVTGKNTSAIIKAALQAYAEGLPEGTPLGDPGAPRGPWSGRRA